MAGPSEGQTAVDALKHVDQGHVVGVIGYIIGGLLTAVGSLLSYIGIMERRRVSTLFKWKDEVVDKALKDIPEKYVGFRACERHHEAIVQAHEALTKAQDATHAEVLHVRRLLESHVEAAERRNGGGP